MSHLIFCFKTNRPGAWRIDGWGLRRRTHNGEYQVPHNAAPDISSSMMKGFSETAGRRPKAGPSGTAGRISRAWHIRGTLPEG